MNKIYIKPENRGKFTKLKERTGHSTTWFIEHGTPAQKKMAIFANNARKWKHKNGGNEDLITITDNGIIPNISLLGKHGAELYPLGNNMFYINANDKRKTDGVYIGDNVAVNDKEVIRITPNEMQVFSNEKMLNGISPSRLVQQGMNPDLVFNAQEEYKDRKGINDNETKKKNGDNVSILRANKVYSNYNDAKDFNMNPILYNIYKKLDKGLSNCTLTVSQWVDPTNPISKASTIVNNPEKYGYSLIDKSDAKAGDIIITKNNKDGYHTMLIEDINEDGLPILRYSKGKQNNEENLVKGITLDNYHKLDNEQKGFHTEELYYRYNKQFGGKTPINNMNLTTGKINNSDKSQLFELNIPSKGIQTMVNYKCGGRKKAFGGLALALPIIQGGMSLLSGLHNLGTNKKAYDNVVDTLKNTNYKSTFSPLSYISNKEYDTRVNVDPILDAIKSKTYSQEKYIRDNTLSSNVARNLLRRNRLENISKTQEVVTAQQNQERQNINERTKLNTTREVSNVQQRSQDLQAENQFNLNKTIAQINALNDYYTNTNQTINSMISGIVNPLSNVANIGLSLLGSNNAEAQKIGMRLFGIK